MLGALKFLVIAPFIFMMTAVINFMTSPGDWWVQWVALGLGIAWFVNLFRVIRGVLLAGGLAVLGLYLWKRFGSGNEAQGQPMAQPAYARQPGAGLPHWVR